MMHCSVNSVIVHKLCYVNSSWAGAQLERDSQILQMHWLKKLSCLQDKLYLYFYIHQDINLMMSWGSSKKQKYVKKKYQILFSRASKVIQSIFLSI